MNIPHRFAISMTDDIGFVERNDIHWHKPAAMPSSAKDRFTIDYEDIFFFTKSPRGYEFTQQLDKYTTALNRYGGETVQADEKREWSDGSGQNIARAGREMRPNPDGRNMRTTWSVNYEPSPNKHYASYPTRLLDIPILAGCPENGIVFDPFMGTGSTAIAAIKLGRRYLGCELQPDYHKILTERLGLEEEKGRLF